MRVTRPPAGPMRSLALAACLLAVVQAGQTVDVALQASFPAPPLLVELLESAATENDKFFEPLLDKVVDGFFSGAKTDEELYNHFLNILEQETFKTDAAALSSWKLALAVHESAPRIEAQYQFWESTLRDSEQQAASPGPSPPLSIYTPSGDRCLEPSCETTQPSQSHGVKDHRSPRPFDRSSALAASSETWTIYADPSDAGAMTSFRTWRSRNPFASFRFRYRAPTSSRGPLTVSGYGVELALKRTDYIVIDDRDAEKRQEEQEVTMDPTTLAGEQLKDVQPLSSSELRDLGLRASSFIMNDPNPFSMLDLVSQDMPKHAFSLANSNISQAFADEHTSNRELFLPPGYNMMWMNGVQISPRNIDPFSLLDAMRRERRLIAGLQDVGLTPSEGVKLLSHPAIASTKENDLVQRYDFRDDVEGNNVIIWLNNVEKDKRYADWSSDLSRVLQRTFPGQLPAVRRDIHNVVIPIDFTDARSVSMVVERLLTLVQRMVPIRFGLVPTLVNQASSEQAKVVYHLHQAYGLAAVVEYLEATLASESLAAPSKKQFDAVVSNRQLRKTQSAVDFSALSSSKAINDRISSTRAYLRRLSADGTNAPVFVNGVAVPFDEDWMESISQRLGADLRRVQKMVYEESIDKEVWVPSILLVGASLVRNPVIVPEDEDAVTIFDMSKLVQQYKPAFFQLRNVHKGEVDQPMLVVFLDLENDAGRDLFVNAVVFAIEHAKTTLAIRQNPISMKALPSDATELAMNALRARKPDMTEAQIDSIKKALHLDDTKAIQQVQLNEAAKLARAIGIGSGQRGMLINGRRVGPLPESSTFTAQDFDTLVDYERKRRLQPALDALSDMQLLTKLKQPLDLAKLSSIIALSTISDIPEGIFDTMPGPRTSVFEQWKDADTSISLGKPETATVQIVVSLDPVSEKAQRWVPILRTLTQLDNVHVRIFLNPRQKLEELPVKRFYRQVISHAPAFSASGALKSPRAIFSGLPEETLLTLAMDTPPSWLVAPKESVYDLDNIKLSSLKRDENVDAIYELEHILIEGHSRETDTGAPPRGVQLVLGTESQATVDGTIIMANIGYFQFKANPGVYDISLKEGKSQKVFNIDSAGTMGHAAKPGDETTEIALISFQGATIFPRLSRMPGKEEEDVLDIPEIAMRQDLALDVSNPVQALLAQGADLVDSLAAKAGIANFDTVELAAGAISWGRGLYAKATSSLQKSLSGSVANSHHADINIFSVASGHLYERMLNIMMVSVMRHTERTVKFWFIEQFLSPSFKTFLPTMAAEYGFEYEMVTYKWPHWLRAQKEKQRVIWGYKILFLDVLFPLDLDKVIFVDADQIVRTDMYDLVQHDLEGAPYGFTPMGDSRTEMEGFRFWKQGYWKNYLRGLPYHISALYVVDLTMFRAMAAGDRLRGQYQSLSSDPNSLSNLDQDLPNHMQMQLPIHSLPQDWLWCETWCDDESLKTAKTIDLCNNPQTKEPKLDRARRQVPEWTEYDDEIAALAKRKSESDPGAAAGVRVEAAEESQAAEPQHGRDEL